MCGVCVCVGTSSSRLNPSRRPSIGLRTTTSDSRPRSPRSDDTDKSSLQQRIDCAWFPQAQLSSLRPLKVPKKLLLVKRRRSEGGEGGGAGDEANQTDLEKSVMKRTASLIKVREILLPFSTLNLYLFHPWVACSGAAADGNA